MYVCVYVYMNVCVCLMYACMYECICVCMYTFVWGVEAYAVCASKCQTDPIHTGTKEGEGVRPLSHMML